MLRRRKHIAAGSLFAALVSACTGVPASPTAAATSVHPPPLAAAVDYQLGGAYPPPKGVKIVVRDRTASPVRGLYNICYVNIFQTQPGTLDWWQENYPDLLLRTKSGSVVKDVVWNEGLFDVSTPSKRARLLAIQQDWLRACATAGFKAIDADNQDSYSRSGGLFRFSANKTHMTAVTAYAHRLGLAVAQKNAAAEYGTTGRTQVGMDFAIAEECGVWDECGEYVAAYGRNVIDIEYTDQPAAAFTAACKTWKRHHSIVRRDRKLVAKGAPGYAYSRCA